MNSILVYYKYEPIVVISNPDYSPIAHVLKWYSTAYEFDIRHLTGVPINTVVYERDMYPTLDNREMEYE